MELLVSALLLTAGFAALAALPLLIGLPVAASICRPDEDGDVVHLDIHFTESGPDTHD